MTDPIDVVELLQELPRRPRGRACVILTRDYADQKDWCVKLSHATETKHLDLLDHLAGDEGANKLSLFSIEGLFNYLQTVSDSKVLIVSGIEFLMATWSSSPNPIEKFASHIEMWSKQPALLFVTQFNNELASRKFNRFPDKLFVVDQQNTISLT